MNSKEGDPVPNGGAINKALKSENTKSSSIKSKYKQTFLDLMQQLNLQERVKLERASTL